MKYKVNVIKRIAFLLMIMALAVAFVACQAATPVKPADPKPGPPGKDAPQLPYLKKGLADVELAASGNMATATVALAGHFIDPHGGTLEYSASSEPSGVVGTSVSGSTLTLTAMKEGTATVTVEAKNKDGTSAFNPGAQFTVAVMKTVPPMVVEGGIPDRTLYQADGPVTLTLTMADADSEGFFSHENGITYEVSSRPQGFVETAEVDGVLTLTPLVIGQTRVTVTATADSKSTTPVTFIVAVVAGSAPKPPENVAPVARQIPPQDMMTGAATQPVDISPFFTDADGDVLTFSNPVSSDPEVATVALSDSTLTITAVAAGTSTLSVTATDPGGLSVTGTVELTVSEPSSSIPDTLNLSVGDRVAPMTHKLELPDGYTLQTADSSKVNVVRTGATGEGNQWRLTARAKTTKPPSVIVYVNDAKNTEHQRINVTVLNSPPARNMTEPSLALLDLDMVDIMFTTKDKDKDAVSSEQGPASYGDGALYDPVITQRILYRTGANSTGNGLRDLNRFYTDADGDPLSFSIEVVAPHIGLILFKTNKDEFLYTVTDEAESPVAGGVHVVYADILTERIDRPIGINIYANDGEATSEESAYFELRNEKPVPRDDNNTDPSTGAAAEHTGNPAYLLTQLQEPGFFRDESYGNRTGVDHIFKFGHATKMVDGVQVLGFTFAHDFLERLEEDGFTIGAADHTLDEDDHLYGVGNNTEIMSKHVTYPKPADDPTDLGAIYYEAMVTGPITQNDVPKIENFVAGSAETAKDGKSVPMVAAYYPEIKFRFNSVGTGSLNIVFGVWADPDAVGSGKSPGWQTETRRIDFKIIGCESVVRIADCP